MATLALGAAAAVATAESTALVAFLASTAAVAAGAYLDQRFVYPALGLAPEKQNLQGNRIDDFQISQASEGSPKNYGSGPKCRVPGTVIWLSEIREEKQSKRVGGKSGVRTSSYSYYIDMAVGVHTGFPVSKIHSIWANGQLVYTQTRSPVLADINSVFTVEKVIYKSYQYVNGTWTLVTQTRMVVKSPYNGPDLSSLSAINTTISGFNNSGNNGTFKCIGSTWILSNYVSLVTLSNVLVKTVAGVTSNAITKKFTRSSGSWITDGFVVGDRIRSSFSSGWLMNNRDFYVTAVTATELTVSDPNSKMMTRTNGTIYLYVKRLTRPSGSFVTDGFTVGSYIIGTMAGSWKLRTVTAGYVEILEGDANGQIGTFEAKTSYIINQINGSSATFVNPNVVAEDSAATATISQSAPAYDKAKLGTVATYDGSQVAADPTIAADVGAANAKVWENEAYFVIKNLSLAEWGNSIPVSWSVLVEVDPDVIELGTAVGRIIERSEISSAEYDVSEINDQKVRGYFYSGPRSGMEAINPLAIAYDFLKQERDGKLYFFPRANAAEIDVSLEHLGANEVGVIGPKPALINRSPARDIASEVLVEYIDAENDFQKGEARSPRTLALINNDVVRTVSLPLVLTAEEADIIANRILWTAIVNGDKFSVQLPPSYLEVLENDIVKLPLYGGTIRMLVQKVSRGVNHLMILEGFVEEAQTLAW